VASAAPIAHVATGPAIEKFITVLSSPLGPVMARLVDQALLLLPVVLAAAHAMPTPPESWPPR
jgi:hypothetical protein